MNQVAQDPRGVARRRAGFRGAGGLLGAARRLTADVDGNNLADDYGSCFLPDVVVTEASDELEPPIGIFFGYLVTGENAVGEGTFTTNSFGVSRPNNSPCP